jgi:hypothetical protein
LGGLKIRQLFVGFRNVARASERWQTLSRKKLAELDGLMDGIKAMRRLLKKMMQNCRCNTLVQCGKGIFRSGCADVAVKSLLLKGRRRPACQRLLYWGRPSVVWGGTDKATNKTEAA